MILKSKQPRIPDNLQGSRSFGWLNRKHLGDQALCIEVHLDRRKELTHLDAGVKFLFGLTDEGEAACQQDVENDAERPDICFVAIVFTLSRYFRRHVRRSAAENFEIHILFSSNTEAKVNDLDSLSIRDKYVLQLKISMNNQLTVHVAYCISNLSEIELSKVFDEPVLRSLPFDNLIETLATDEFLHENHDAVLVLSLFEVSVELGEELAL